MLSGNSLVKFAADTCLVPSANVGTPQQEMDNIATWAAANNLKFTVSKSKEIFPFNISATAEASDFKFGTQLGFAMAIIKSQPEEKWAWPWARAAPKNFGFLYNITATAGASDFKFEVGFAKACHKITHRRKGGRGRGLW